MRDVLRFGRAPAEKVEPVDLREAVRSVLSQYATFSGRASRSEYWWWVLFYMVIYFAFYFAILFIGLAFPATMNADGSVSAGIGGVISLVLFVLMFATMLAIFIPSLAVLVRRLHDTGKSGLFVLIAFVPLVGPLIMIFFCVQPSDPHTNQYGVPAGVPLDNSAALGMQEHIGVQPAGGDIASTPGVAGDAGPSDPGDALAGGASAGEASKGRV